MKKVERVNLYMACTHMPFAGVLNGGLGGLNFHNIVFPSRGLRTYTHLNKGECEKMEEE